MNFVQPNDEIRRTVPARILIGGHRLVKQAIEPAVAAVFGVRPDELRASTRRSAHTAFARQVAMYLAHVVCGLSLTEVGLLFARDRTTVAHACGVVEDRRDDPEIDRTLDHLEVAVSCLLDALRLSGGYR